MSVIIETSKGDLVVDLFVDDCPKAATNFLKCGRRGCWLPPPILLHAGAPLC